MMIHFYLVLALLLHVALSHVVTDVNKDYIVQGTLVADGLQAPILDKIKTYVAPDDVTPEDCNLSTALKMGRFGGKPVTCRPDGHWKFSNWVDQMSTGARAISTSTTQFVVSGITGYQRAALFDDVTLGTVYDDARYYSIQADGWDATTGFYTVQQSGTYVVSVDIAGTSVCEATIVIDGVLPARVPNARQIVVDGSSRSSFNMPLSLTTGQTVEILSSSSYLPTRVLLSIVQLSDSTSPFTPVSEVISAYCNNTISVSGAARGGCHPDEYGHVVSPHYNTNTGIITVPRSGTYLVSARYDGCTTGGRLWLQVGASSGSSEINDERASISEETIPFSTSVMYLEKDMLFYIQGHTSVCQAPTILTLALLHPDSDYIAFKGEYIESPDFFEAGTETGFKKVKIPRERRPHLKGGITHGRPEEDSQGLVAGFRGIYAFQVWFTDLEQIMVGGVLKFIILVDNVVIDRYEMNDSNGGRNTAQVKFLSLKPSQKVTIQFSDSAVSAERNTIYETSLVLVAPIPTWNV